MQPMLIEAVSTSTLITESKVTDDAVGVAQSGVAAKAAPPPPDDAYDRGPGDLDHMFAEDLARKFQEEEDAAFARSLGAM